jgi:hypothetical protein
VQTNKVFIGAYNLLFEFLILLCMLPSVIFKVPEELQHELLRLAGCVYRMRNKSQADCCQTESNN